MKNCLLRYLDKNSFENTVSQRAREYWNRHMEEHKHESVWTSNPLIAGSVYRKMTKGSNKFWLTWLVEDYLPKGNQIKNVLSICCGAGDHEIIMGKLNKEWHIDAFDISDESIIMAKQKARANKINNINFFTADVNTLSVEDIGSYDLILASGALHHVNELENLFFVLQQKLKPLGYFAINEFCGPSRHQWTDKQIDISNKLLNAILPNLRIRKNEQIKCPTIEEMIKHDPSESIRSFEIHSLLSKFFKIEYESKYGGTILHNLYPKLNHKYFKERKDYCDSIIQLLIAFEEILIDEGVIESDFKFFVARKIEMMNEKELA